MAGRKRKREEEAAGGSERRTKKRRKKSTKKRRKTGTVKKRRATGRRRGGRSKTTAAPKKKKKSRRGRRAGKGGIPGVRGGIPVEGLVGGGVVGRYPGPAKPIEKLVTRFWRPDENQDLNKTDIIQFSMKTRKGQLIRYDSTVSV